MFNKSGVPCLLQALLDKAETTSLENSFTVKLLIYHECTKQIKLIVWKD